MAADDKVVIGQTHGTDDPEAVLIGYLLGVEALRAGKEVLMWLTKDGVHLATNGYADAISVPDAPQSPHCMPSTSNAADAFSPAPFASRAAALMMQNGCKAPK